MRIEKKTIFAAIAVWLGFCLAVGACIRALTAPVAVSVQAAKLSVVIDAGHGGVDGGVVGVATKRKENDVNLSIAFLLGYTTRPPLVLNVGICKSGRKFARAQTRSACFPCIKTFIRLPL